MQTVLHRPRFWLAVEMAAVAAVGGACGWFALERLPDSPTYVAAAEMPLGEMLGCPRTIGYPLFLKAAALLSPELRLVPWLHLATLFGVVFFFDGSLRRFGAAPWVAFAASTALLAAAFQDAAVRILLADFLAMLAAVVTVGFLFRLAADPRRVATWAGLAVALAVTYHVRPAYLFLIPLVPILGVVLRWMATRRQGQRLAWLRLGTGLGAASIGPYVAYCSLRLVLVGHFGLVSFGGMSIVGIAAELIDEGMIRRELPPSMRPLAADIARRRAEMGLETVFRGGGVIRVRQWELQYNDNVWRAAVPAATAIYGRNPREINDRLAEFSKAVIRRRPGPYLLFVAYSFPRALAKYFYCSWTAQVLLLAGLTLWAIRRRRTRHPVGGANTPDAPRPGPVDAMLPAVAAAAALLLLAKAALLVLVICVGSRYILPAGVLVPPALALWVLRAGQGLWAAGRTAHTEQATDRREARRADAPATHAYRGRRPDRRAAA